MHPVEALWTRIRKNELMQTLIQAMPKMRQMEAEKAGKIPNEVVIPTHAVNMAILGMAMEAKMLGKDPARVVNTANRLSWSTSGWLTYRESKRIFQFTPELARELDKLRQPLSFPVESLTIPARCIVLDFSAYLGPQDPNAYIMVSYDCGKAGMTDDGPWIKVLNISQVYPHADKQPDVRLTHLPVSTDGQSIYGAFRDMMVEARDNLVASIAKLNTIEENRPADAERKASLARLWEEELGHYDRDINGGPAAMIECIPILPLVINALFYIRGDKDVVREIHPGAPPSFTRPGANLRKLAHRTDLAPAKVQVLGEKFTQALKHYELEKEKFQAQAEKGTKSPHLRRPHLHTYRIGEGRTGFTLRFLGWQGIAGAVVPEAMNEMFATITPVE